MASVLVVEDNADLRDMYGEILAIDGHAVHAAATADAALHALEACPDVVVLDLSVIPAEEVLAAAQRPPRLVLASGVNDLPEHATRTGAAAYLRKPFRPEQLLEAVARAAARA